LVFAGLESLFFCFANINRSVNGAITQMKNLRGILMNLSWIDFLAVKNRDYNNPEIQQSLVAIDYLLAQSNPISPENIRVLNKDVNERVNELENIRDNEEAARERKEQINSLIENLRRIISQCRRLQNPEKLVMELELTLKIS
jgi:hypothetical protein